MGDDPYNFEIALPTTPIHANSSTRKHYANGSDEDVSNVSGSLSSMSGISSDNCSDRESDHEEQQRTDLSFKRPVKSANESKMLTPSTGTALDRAKNFLSKYSNVSTDDRNDIKTPLSSRSRRVSLDDDDDFSVESSDDEENTNNKKAAAMSFNSGFTAIKQGSDRSNDNGIVPNSDGKRLKNLVGFQSDENESGQSSDHPPAYSETPSALPTRRESNSDESEVGDSIDSFHSEASERPIESVPVLEIPPKMQPKPAYHEDSGDDYNESFQEESLSQSNVVDDQHRDIQPIEATPAFISMKPQQMIVSDSEIYEEEGFEQDDSVAPGLAASIAPQSILTTDKSFDYSMDFSDNEVEAAVQPQCPLPQSIVDDPVRQDSGSPQSSAISIQSDYDGENGEQSELLESDSFQDERGEHLADDTYVTTASSKAVKQSLSVCIEVPVDRSTPMPESSGSHEQSFSQHDRSSYPFSKDDEIQAPIHKTTDTPPILTAPPQKVLPLEARATDKDTSTAKKHVIIVRAFHPNEEEHVEMKDASTQFTGNHTAIQTDLIPDGMHSVFLSAPTQPPTVTSPSLDLKNDARLCDDNPNPCRCEQQLPPTPPISPLFGSPFNNLEALSTAKDDFHVTIQAAAPYFTGTDSTEKTRDGANSS